MHHKQAEPMRCPHHGETVVTEIAYVQKRPDGTKIFLCATHAALVAACGIRLDSLKRQSSETRHRALSGLRSAWEGRKRGVADRAENWSHQAKRPGVHRRVHISNVTMAHISGRGR